MSLLLQALQKAAKSREDGQGEQSMDVPQGGDALALEPIAPEPVLREDMPAAGPTPAQAATVLEANRTPRFDPIEYAREHQMLVFLAAAVLFAIGYGTYVYIQVASPSLFRSRPAPALLVSAPPAPVVVAQPAASEKISGFPESADAGGGTPAPAPGAPSAAGSSIFDSPPASAAPSTAPRPGPTPSALSVATSAVTQPPARRRPAATVEPAGVASTSAARASRFEDPDGVETFTIQPSAQQGIAVSRQPATTVPIDPTLMQAYEALQQGDYERARGLYEQVRQADPRNIDALLGLAAIAGRNGQTTPATRYYQNVLELDPRNTYAQVGLLSLVGGADPLAAESRIKLLIARDPSAMLYFTLGNLYAEQGQWPSAQQAYFQAYQLQSDNADYAFNLAVGLEHMGQGRLALDYYRKALDLSFRKGRANFDQNLVIQRVGQLSSRVEQ